MHRAAVLALFAGSCALGAPAVAVAASSVAPAPPATGGVAAGEDTGAPAYDPRRPDPPRPRVRQFTVSPRTLVRGTPARMTLRIDGPTRLVRVRVDVVRRGGGGRLRVDLGRERTGRRITRSWSPRRKLKPGRYVARLHAVDTAGQRLRRAAARRLRIVAPAPPRPVPPPPPAAAPPAPAPAAPAPTPAPTAPAAGGAFPVQGPYSLGGEGSRFGAERHGHVHQGQDISAAEGTPVISPLAGVVYWRDYQAKGAGHHLVIRTDAGPDLVFMHLRSGSITVSKGQRVRARQRIAEVGSTGGSDGPHLHFEIWPQGWWSEGSSPIDPLTQLAAWANGR